MRLIIHGTNDGYCQIYPTIVDGESTISQDVGHGENGLSVFSIERVKDGIYFSCHLFVEDSIADNRNGAITFTIFLEHKERLNGELVVKHLNEIKHFFVNECDLITSSFELSKKLSDFDVIWRGFVDGQYSQILSECERDIVEEIPFNYSDEFAFTFYESVNDLIAFFDYTKKLEYIAFRRYNQRKYANSRFSKV